MRNVDPLAAAPPAPASPHLPPEGAEAESACGLWLASPMHAALVHLAEVIGAHTRAPLIGVALFEAASPQDGVPRGHARVRPMPAARFKSGPEPAWEELSSAAERWPLGPTGLFAALRRAMPPQGVYLDQEVEERTGLSAERAVATPIQGWWPRWQAVLVVDLPERGERAEPGGRAALAVLHDVEQPPRHEVRRRLRELAEPVTARLRMARLGPAAAGEPGGEPVVLEPPRVARRLTSLSRTENEVLRRLLDGPITEKQVADDMHRSPHTIHVHVKSIYRKLGVSSRNELRRVLGRRGGSQRAGAVDAAA